ncbi:uncharacterized protein L969DRAFT_97445 [Mixia osmundae IAM 14324]|uniref:Uncharacterized protein n=1 Tax=Mixia osmundae (strain CBS 9802 / IAM 14324 / JCM 22182 / KY 12970) TaxID=764103 RepID=G7E4I1_MIXOS|nr:uncharacterized protein L969DRAFT_97445 [Mixia osmundae IAM 14324]KEI36242.1 hypothetical protein L969DRAFT_97445 [Mixia osmundae IAM 14324]GAA97741.1 hypothetical protein E5Q_04420 [Mixia osmundae IAM 14324]
MSTAKLLPQRTCIAPGALDTPVHTFLADKRVILASASPRRSEILRQIGLAPEIIPSTFSENLPHDSFADDELGLGAYAVATASEKALEVYLRLVEQSPEDAPDLVIGADTVVLLDHAILEKPGTKAENMRMLLELNGRTHQVATGIVLVIPCLTSPGYVIKTLLETTTVEFAENPTEVLQAYVNSEEGLDRAGGYAIQGKASVLVRSISGDYSNVVGLPGAALFHWLYELIANEELDLLS